MNSFKNFRSRLAAPFRKRELDSDMDAEMRSHIELRTQANIAAGMSTKEARYAALRQFGHTESIKEDCRDQRGVRWLEHLAQDVRFGARQLRKNPGFTAVAVLTLALGIGANTSIFTLVNAVLLKKLPVHEPDRLVLFRSVAPREFDVGGYTGNSTTDPATGRNSMTSFPYQSFQRMSERPGALSDIIAFGNLSHGLSVTADGLADLAVGQAVSGNYFSGLGLRPFLGRLLTVEDDAASASPVAVISHRYWQQRFGGNAGIIGKQIALNHVAFSIVGVTPPGFEGAMDIGSTLDVTIPISWEPQLVAKKEDSRLYGAGEWWLRLMGRLKPRATVEQARIGLETTFYQSLVEQRAARRPKVPTPGGNTVNDLDPKFYPRLFLDPGGRGEMNTRQRYAPSLYLLQAVVGLVLLIACANLANLLFSRAAARQKEVALRLALGATRWRLIRQLLTESALLSSMGGVLGILLALWIKNGLLAVSDWGGSGMSGVVPRLDWRVLGFTTGLSSLTGILFGFAPAWRSTNVEFAPALKEAGRGSNAGSRSLLSRGLVVSQVALSLLLVVGAALSVRTLLNLERVAVGFNTDNLLLFHVQPALFGYTGAKLEQIHQRLAERLEGLAGVKAVTFSSQPLLSGAEDLDAVLLRDRRGYAHILLVRENFLEAMGIPLLAGRSLRFQDDARGPRVAVVNEAFAHQFFPNENPVGKRFAFDPNQPDSVEIIGLATDASYTRQRDPAPATAYLSWRQEIPRLDWGVTYELRTSGAPSAAVASVRRTVREVDAALPIKDVRTQVPQAGETLRMERLFAKLQTLFGVLAQLLASIGLFGVMAYAVSQRTREIGIRMALGAARRDVLTMIVREGMTLAMLGIALGLIGAFSSTRVLHSQLFGVSPSDPATFAAVSALLSVIALLACCLPARRASRVEPMVALRTE
jgi:predicted permease